MIEIHEIHVMNANLNLLILNYDGALSD